LPAVETPPAAARLGPDAALIGEAARAAGRVALGFFRASPQVWTKGDASPVTEADIAVDQHLASVLRTARPDYGWLSEESIEQAGASGRRFIVDPIDGTRSFIGGLEDWSISVAVVDGPRPVAAALYCPVRDELFLAERGKGAWLGGTRLATSGATALAGSHAAGPGHLFDHACFRGAGVERVAKIHSLAYRLAGVAAGRYDAAAASARACHWDLAAADLLVHEAGGRLTDLAGREARYDAIDVRHPPLVAATPALHDAFAALVGGILGPSRRAAKPAPDAALRS
jgi:myo-inositol-1(or 4)-monophosphatase